MTLPLIIADVSVTLKIAIIQLITDVGIEGVMGKRAFLVIDYNPTCSIAYISRTNTTVVNSGLLFTKAFLRTSVHEGSGIHDIFLHNQLHYTRSSLRQCYRLL